MEKLGKYQIVEKVGVGGFGVVYKALDPFIKRHVAIKTCSAEDRETRERFLREAEICGNLQHRNIVTVFEFGFEQETPYLVQEYLSGEDLDKKIKRRDPMPMAERILWLVQIARGLEYAHARGIVHRDIKPSNIRILEDDTAKILDFGIAKLAQQQSTLTQAGITLGTAAYLAPEQVRGEAVDPRTDVFSFGVLAYELLAHERPFQAKEISAIFYRILNEPPPRLATTVPDCPPELAAIVERCLEKDPARRFSPTTELVRALETLMRRRPPDMTSEPTRHHPLPPAEKTTVVPPVIRPGEHSVPAPAAAGRRPGGLDDLELSYPEGAPRPQSRAMATMAFGGHGHAKRWLAAGAAGLAAIGLLAVALLVARPQSAPPPTATSTPAPGQKTAPPGPLPTPTAQPTATPQLPAPTPDPRPTAAPTPEPPKLGRLIVAAGWDGATTVRIAGRRYRLDREQTIELPAGRYDLDFALETPAYALAHSDRVEVEAGGTRRVEVPLQRPGRLSVQPHLNTRGGTVRLDGEMVGASPLRGRWLPPGEHFVEVFASADPGAEPPVKQTVTIVSDQETVLTFDLDGKLETQVRSRPLGGG